MRTFAVLLLLSLPFIVLACPEQGGGTGNGSEGEGEGEGEPDAGPPPLDVFGIDERPLNTTCIAPAPPPVGAGTLALVEPWPSLNVNRPVYMLQEPDTEQMFVVQQDGRVVRFDSGDAAVVNPIEFGNIQDRVSDPAPGGGTEDGLLGMAFHPDWPTVEEVFLFYNTYESGTLTDRVGRFQIEGDGTLDEGNEEILLDIEDFAGNHNGGMIAFGTDGYLYIGTGDGGSGFDPDENGQSGTSLLGKFLRIDVDTAESGNNYGIPADNPFVGPDGIADEVWALGLRNPWRWSFDRETDELWAADVGQRRWEEVNLIEKGGNYGWDVYEGVECVNDEAGPSGPCDLGGTKDPVGFYFHDSGRCSITGGFVYRGSAMPELQGTYFFGDHCSSEVFALVYDGDLATPVEVANNQANVNAFAQDAAGELYVISTTSGIIERLTRQDAPQPSTFPETLSATGCMDPDDPALPGPGLIPYTVNHALYSDGATKERWMALPDGQNATVDPASGDIDFPVGTVFVKNFRVEDELVETRLLIRHADDQWGGYSYEWNADGTDATLLPAGKSKVVDNGQTWTYPSRNACLVCHTEAAGRSLGLEIAQLNGGYTYESTGVFANQLVTLEHIGVLALPAPVTELDVFPAIGATGFSVEARARAYLHVNCANCHVPGGTGQSDADLRWQTAFSEMNICNEAPQEGELGVAGAQLLAPGNPGLSLLSIRMHRIGAGRMPLIGSAVVDDVGVGVIDGWIEGLSACP